MSAANKLVFADHDAVGGSPTIDGFAMADVGVLSSDVEGGYINGGRVTLGNSSGLPPVVIQAIRDGDTIVFGIMCRGDKSFDDLDGVVIGLRPSGSASGGPQRKIHVFPMWGDHPDSADVDPNDPSTLGVGYGAADPDPVNSSLHLFVPPEDPQYTIRKNKPPHLVQYFGRAGASGAWASAVPGEAGDPAKFHLRTRSWLPPVPAGSPFEYAWSVEIRVPVSNAAAGGDWLDLADDFGVYIDVVRSFRVFDDDGNPDFQVSHHVFPIGAPFLDPIQPSTDIPAGSFGHGLMGSAAANGEGVRIKDGALGIGRRAPGLPGAPLTGVIRVDEPNVIVAKLENTGPLAEKISAQVHVAQFGLNGPDDWSPHWVQPASLQNPGPQISVPGVSGIPGEGETTNDWTVSGADSTFYSTRPHQCIWVQLHSGDPNVTFSQASVRRNMDFAGFSEINRDIVISGDGYPEPEDGSGEHEFLMHTRCRKLVVRELVKAPPAAIDDSTRILVEGALFHDSGEKRPDHLAMEATTLDGTPELFSKAAAADNDQQWQDTVVYLWITEGFRRTGKRTEINGVGAELLDESPGDFAICARHEGVEDPMNWTFSGGGMVQHAPGVYSIKVPHKDKVEVKVRLAAGPEERPGDRSDLPKPRKPRGSADSDPKENPLPGGCGKWLARLLRLLGIRT